MFAGSLMLVLLAVLTPTNAIAGPPEGVSGRIVLDDVADGLRRYRKEKDPEKGLLWLEVLARTQDVRVEVVLGELREAGVAKGASGEVNRLGFAAHCLLQKHYGLSIYKTDKEMRKWWRDNEADLHRRAKQLAQ
jgi:hypothetical protein